MIDIENKIINTIAEALPDIKVYSSFELNPEEFPCVMVDYEYAGDYVNSFDEQLTPHHARISVQIDTFALSKDQAKQTNATVVNAMHGMKFRCTDSVNWGQYSEGIHRMTSRFSAVVQEAQDINGNTVYQMYRN